MKTKIAVYDMVCKVIFDICHGVQSHTSENNSHHFLNENPNDRLSYVQQFELPLDSS